jgi:hypothetical protein
VLFVCLVSQAGAVVSPAAGQAAPRAAAASMHDMHCEAGLEAMEGQAELHMRATALLKVVVALPARLLPLVRHLPLTGASNTRA